MGRSVALRTCGALTPHPPDLRWSRWGTLVATWDRWKYQKVGSQSRVPGLVCKLRLQTRDSLNCPWRLRDCDNKQTSQQEEHEALEPKSPATGRGLGQRGGCQLSLNLGSGLLGTKAQTLPVWPALHHHPAPAILRVTTHPLEQTQQLD